MRIEVEIDTKGTAGHFARDVVLVTNSTDPGLREIVLGTRGEVVGTVRADPSQLSFGAVDYGSIHHKTLRIEALDPKVLRTLSSVSCSDSHLSAAFTLINDESAELTVKGAFENMIDGDFFARIDLNFDHPEIKVLSIDVNGRVRSRVHVVPRVVVVSGRADSWSHSFRVQSLDDVEFNLVAVDAPDGVAAGWTPGRAKSFTIHLAPEEGRSRIPSGMHAVSIATDLEGAASVQVPLLVQLQP